MTRVDTSEIFDLVLDGLTTAQNVDEYIDDLARITGLDIHLLYFTLSSDQKKETQKNNDRAAAASSRPLSVLRTASVAGFGRFRDGKTALNTNNKQQKSASYAVAHLYGFTDGGDFLSLDELNR